jgi:predicted nucleic acid-binding protein
LIGFLLDTNVIAELIRAGGSIRVKQWAAAQDEATLYLSILTIAEYDKGIANLAEDEPRRHIYSAARDRLAERFDARLLAVSDAIVRRWGAISGRVKRACGHAPPVIDTLLAATALEHDLYLVTRNVRDVQASGAAMFNPWDDDGANAAISTRRSARRSRLSR